jgi:23S rRNA (adenine2503-C2)-methyltransferase
MDARTNLFGLSREQLVAALTALGEPAYRGGQVYRWLYGKRVRAIAEMTDLPKPVRDKIHDSYVLR